MTTWNAADKDDVTLSGSDLVATSTSTTAGARSTTSIAAGKVAFSAVLTGFDDSESYVGISKAAAAYDGSDANSAVLGYAPGFGYFVLNAGGIAVGPDASSPAPTGTDTVVVLLDSAGKLYFQCNGNTLFGANPVAGTGGVTIATGSWFANVAFTGSGRAATANFSPGSLPSGFSAWDGGGGSPFSVAANGGTYSVTGTAVALRQKPDWTLVGITEATVNASGNYTLSEPSGAQQDDILVVDIAIRSNVLHTNADWTFPQSDSTGNTTNNTTGSIVSYQTGYCIRGSSAPSYVFAKTGGSRSLGTVRAYRSSEAGTPSFDTSAEVAMGSAGTAVTITGGITTTAANELLVTGVFGARANTVSNMDGTTEVTGNSGATDTTTPPVRGTWTERSDRSNGTSPTVALACYDTIKVTAGSTGDLTATESQSARHGMTVMAFKHPASGSNKTIAADGGTYAVTGAAVTTRRSRKVDASGGSYAVTGAAVTLRRNLPLVVGGGSYSVTGAAVTLKEARKVSALGGSYSVTGSAVTLRYGYAIGVGTGSYAITGAAVTLRHAYLVGVSAGSYSVNGASVTLTKAAANIIAVGAGSYAVTGAAVSLVHKWAVGAAASSYSITGAAATLRSGASVVAGAGSYSITGATVAILALRRVNADSGAYAISGSDVALNINDPFGGVTNPLENLKMYTGTLGAVSNREDWIVNISFTGEDGSLFDLSSATEIEVFVCRPECPNNPILSASLGEGIALTDNYHMQWAFTADDMSNLCADQYDVFSRVTIDGIVTQTIAAGMPVIEGGPR